MVEKEGIVRKAQLTREQRRHTAWSMQQDGYSLEDVAISMHTYRHIAHDLVTEHKVWPCRWCPPVEERLAQSATTTAQSAEHSAWRTHRWWRKEEQ